MRDMRVVMTTRMSVVFSCFLLSLLVPAAPGRAEMNASEGIKREGTRPAAPDSSAEAKREEPTEQADEQMAFV